MPTPLEISTQPGGDGIPVVTVAGEIDMTLGRGLSTEQGVQLQNQWRDGRVTYDYKSWLAVYRQYIDPNPPVSGNDATVAGLQLIIAGDQYNTISKPSEIVAAAAAQIAVQFLNGETPKAEMTLYDTPSQLFTPAVVTRENL